MISNKNAKHGHVAHYLFNDMDSVASVCGLTINWILLFISFIAKNSVLNGLTKT